MAEHILVKDRKMKKMVVNEILKLINWVNSVEMLAVCSGTEIGEVMD